MDFPLKIVHIDELAATVAFTSFEPLNDDSLPDYTRKRDGRFQMIILRDVSEDDIAIFMNRCKREPSVETVLESTFEEFQQAPSNSI
jgi:hypothetical protein